jgi:hypothetical protein
MSRDRNRVGSKRRTAVRITGEGMGQNLFGGQEVPLGYLFLPDTRPEPLHKMCRTFQTSAHAFSRRWPPLFGLRGRPGIPGTRIELAKKSHRCQFFKVVVH